MKLNSNTVIISERVHLVPYRPEHVTKYHEWMSDAEIRHATGTEEELSLEEEFQHQKEWADDDTKLTFIIIDGADGSTMIGDVNCFAMEPETDENGAEIDGKKRMEIDIMIAEKAYRRKGLGQEVVGLMMHYCIRALEVETFVAKINDDNPGSVKLFEERLGFNLESHSSVFKQSTYSLTPSTHQIASFPVSTNTRPYDEET